MNMPQRFGHYLLLERMTAGGMAEVFRAKTQGVGGFEKILAIKRIHPKFSSEDKFIKMMADEANITVRLAHPNIAQVFDLGEIDGMYYIAMEYIDGRDLYKLLRRAQDQQRRIPVEAAVYVAHELCAGLDYAHKREERGSPLGIIHRDVSPQNILISFDGQVKLVDFGIAKHAIRSRETEAGIIKGKFSYMSPEQAWGDPIDHRTDIFSTGIVLYEALTGSMVYAESDELRLLDRIRKAEIPSPRRLRPDIPEELEAIVMRALHKRADSRYQTAQEFQSALSRFLYTRPVQFGPPRMAALLRELFPEGPDAEREAQLRRETEALGLMSRAEFPTGTAGSFVDAHGTSEGRGDHRVKTDPGADSDAETRVWDKRKQQNKARPEPQAEDTDYEENSDIVDSEDGYEGSGAKRPLAAAAARAAAARAEPVQRGGQRGTRNPETGVYEVLENDDLHEVPESVAAPIDNEHTVVDMVNPFYEGPAPVGARRPAREVSPSRAERAAAHDRELAAATALLNVSQGAQDAAQAAAQAAELRSTLPISPREPIAPIRNVGGGAPLVAPASTGGESGSTLLGLGGKDAPPWQRNEDEFTNVFTPPPGGGAGSTPRNRRAGGAAAPADASALAPVLAAPTSAAPRATAPSGPPSLLAEAGPLPPHGAPKAGASRAGGVSGALSGTAGALPATTAGDPRSIAEPLPASRTTSPARAPHKGSSTPVFIALTVLLLGGGGLAAWWFLREDATPPQPVSRELTTPEKPTPMAGSPAPAVSPALATAGSAVAANPALPATGSAVAANPALPATGSAAAANPALPATGSAVAANPALPATGSAVAVAAPTAAGAATASASGSGSAPAKKSAPAAVLGKVLVETKPGGAMVFVNGDQRGKAGSWLELPAGRDYELEIRKEGWRTVQQTLEVAEGSQRLFFSLEKGRAKKPKRAAPKRKAKAVAAARPAPAEVEPSRAPEPTPRPDPTPEPDPEPAPKRTVKAPEPATATSEPEHGFLNVNAKPWGEVHVDGRKVADQTPLMGLKLRPGVHRVRIYFVTLQKMSEERKVMIGGGKTQGLVFKQ